MTARIWFKVVRNSVLAAALLTAAQVGVGGGVGVIDWQRGGLTTLGWGQLLTWISFVFTVGVLGGAAVGQRFVPARLKFAAPGASPSAASSGRGRVHFGITVVAAISAGLGSAAAFPLVWLPVITTRPAVDPSPIQSIAITAGFGVLVGVVLALATLTWGAVATGAGLGAGWVWLFALGSAALGAVQHTRASPGLGLLDIPAGMAAPAWWYGPYLMVGIALFLGLIVPAAAGWRGANWVGMGLSGLAGPVLVASPYLITGWGVTGNGEDASPYIASVIAILVGLIASAAVAAPQRRRATPLTRREGAPRQVSSRPGQTSPAVAVVTSSTSIPPGGITSAGSAPAPAGRSSRPVAIESGRPLAISSYAEPAYPVGYTADLSGATPTYSHDPAYRTDPVYLEPISTERYPAADRPGRTSGANPVTAYSADPYSSDAFVVSKQTFDADLFPGAAPTPPPAPVSPPAPTPAPPSPVMFQPAAPISAPPSRPVYLQPAQLAESGFAKAASESEPGHAERVLRTPAAPAPSAPVRGRGKKAAPVVPAPVATPTPAVPTPPAPTPPAVPGPVTAAAVPAAPMLTGRKAERAAKAAAAAAKEAAAREAKEAAIRAAAERKEEAARAAQARKDGAAREIQARKEAAALAAAQKAAAQKPAASQRAKPVEPPVSPLRAGSIEGEIVAGSTSPGSTGPTTPTGPSRPVQPNRRSRKKSDDKPLRKGEAEHIDWVSNLVHIPADTELKTSKER